MSTHETIGSSNPSSSSTPIESSESPLMVHEDNRTLCSCPTPMDTQIDGQPENEDVEGIRKLTLSMWNHFKKRKIDRIFKAVCNYCSRHLGGDIKMGLGICIITSKDVQGERLKTSSNKSWCKNKIK